MPCRGARRGEWSDLLGAADGTKTRRVASLITDAAMDGTESPAMPPAGTDAGKRKAEEQPQVSPKLAKRTPPPLVSLKGHRLTLRQKAVGWDRTMPVLRGA